MSDFSNFSYFSFSPQRTRSLTEFILGMIYLLTPFVIQSEAKNLGNTIAGVNVDVHEILPPYGRLNDKYK